MEIQASRDHSGRFSLDTGLALQKFYESAPMLMGIVEVEAGDIIHVYDNPASATFFGLPSGLTGVRTSTLGTTPETIKLWVDQYKKAQIEQKPIQFEYAYNKRGLKVTFSVVVTFMEMTARGVPRFSYIAQDMSEIVLLQGMISASPFKKIINAIPQIVWTATPEGVIDWYNEQWHEFSGMERGPDWHDPESPMHPDDKNSTLLKWEECLKTGEVFETEYRFLRHSDQQYRWFLGRAVPIRDEEGKIMKWIGSDTDIHDQKTLFHQVAEERDLREKITASVSHDLRTPLTAAKMSAQLLMKKNSDPAVIKGAHRINENMDRADAMIRDLLDVSRFRAGGKILLNLSECHLKSLTTDTLNELTTIHGDRFVLNAKEEIEGYWSCQGIRRILENLCSNAIKYGDPEANVTVTLEKQPNQATIKILNTGNPIPEADQPFIFDPFRRTEASKSSGQKGWGIGLSLVKALAEAHGGSVGLKSNGEEGTTFQVVLPLSGPS